MNPPPPAPRLSTGQAAARLRAGALLAYPTEAVWGLGCDPFDAAAVQRLLALKQRPADKGLILIAADLAQLDPLLDWPALDAGQRQQVLSDWPGPHTWIIPAREAAPAWITGSHAGLAVRITAHPVAAALCRAFGGPLVSTSANLAGLPPVRTHDALDPRLLAGIDGVVEGLVGDLAQPTPIRDARSGQVLRT